MQNIKKFTQTEFLKAKFLPHNHVNLYLPRLDLSREATSLPWVVILWLILHGYLYLPWLKITLGNLLFSFGNYTLINFPLGNPKKAKLTPSMYIYTIKFNLGNPILTLVKFTLGNIILILGKYPR